MSGKNDDFEGGDPKSCKITQKAVDEPGNLQYNNTCQSKGAVMKHHGALFLFVSE